MHKSCMMLAEIDLLCMHFATPMTENFVNQINDSEELCDGSLSARRAGRENQRRKPDGHRRVSICRICASETGTTPRAVQADELRAGGAAQDQEDHGLSPRRHQLPRQRRT